MHSRLMIYEMKVFIIKVWLTIALLWGALGASAYDFMVDGIAYEITSSSDFTCAVVKADGKYEGKLIIPATVSYKGRDLTVTSVGYECFKNNENLTSVVIPSTVREMGTACFSGCVSLTSVTLPESLTSLGGSFFSGCSSLASINLPPKLESLGIGCFIGCSSLTSINLPDGIVSLGDYCFEGSGLIEITLPSTCKIGANCFMSCKHLYSAKVNCDINYGTFNNSMLSSLEIGDGCNSIVEAYLNHSLWTNTNPDIEYSYNRYEVYLDKFPFPTTLKSLVIKDSSVPIELELSAEFLESLPNYQIVCGERYGNSDEKMIESWSESLEKLYLGRGLNTNKYYPQNSSGTSVFSRRLECPNLSELTIGPLVDEIPIYLGELKNLIFLNVLNTTPPRTIGSFTNRQYTDLVVTVPEEALETYKNDPVWGKFWNIGVAGVETVNRDSTKTVIGRYDLSGRPVNSSFKGLTIVRFSDGSARKVIQ